MASQLLFLALGAGVAGGVYYATQQRRQVATQKQSASVATDVNNRVQPVCPLSEVLYAKDVANKALTLLDVSEGPNGTTKYKYFVPASGQVTYSYAPLDGF